MFIKTVAFGILAALLMCAGASAKATYTYQKNTTRYDLVTYVNNGNFPAGNIEPVEGGFGNAMYESWFF